MQIEQRADTSAQCAQHAHKCTMCTSNLRHKHTLSELLENLDPWTQRWSLPSQPVESASMWPRRRNLPEQVGCGQRGVNSDVSKVVERRCLIPPSLVLSPLHEWDTKGGVIHVSSKQTLHKGFFSERYLYHTYPRVPEDASPHA